MSFKTIEIDGVLPRLHKVEQERDPLNAGGSLGDVKASRESLRQLGF